MAHNTIQWDLSVYQLSTNGNRYQKPVQFRGGDRIISPTFNSLQLTAEQIFATFN